MDEMAVVHHPDQCRRAAAVASLAESCSEAPNASAEPAALRSSERNSRAEPKTLEAGTSHSGMKKRFVVACERENCL